MNVNLQSTCIVNDTAIGFIESNTINSSKINRNLSSLKTRLTELNVTNLPTRCWQFRNVQDLNYQEVDSVILARIIALILIVINICNINCSLCSVFCSQCLKLTRVTPLVCVLIGCQTALHSCLQHCVYTLILRHLHS